MTTCHYVLGDKAFDDHIVEAVAMARRHAPRFGWRAVSLQELRRGEDAAAAPWLLGPVATPALVQRIDNARGFARKLELPAADGAATTWIGLLDGASASEVRRAVHYALRVCSLKRVRELVVVRASDDAQGDLLWRTVAAMASGIEQLRLTRRVAREVMRDARTPLDAPRLVIATCHAADAVDPLAVVSRPGLSCLPAALLMPSTVVFAPRSVSAREGSDQGSVWATWRCAGMWARAVGEGALAARMMARAEEVFGATAQPSPSVRPPRPGRVQALAG